MEMEKQSKAIKSFIRRDGKGENEAKEVEE